MEARPPVDYFRLTFQVRMSILVSPKFDDHSQILLLLGIRYGMYVLAIS